LKYGIQPLARNQITNYRKGLKPRTIDLRMKEFELYILRLRLKINLSSIFVSTSNYDCYTTHSFYKAKNSLKEKNKP